MSNSSTSGGGVLGLSSKSKRSSSESSSSESATFRSLLFFDSFLFLVGWLVDWLFDKCLFKGKKPQRTKLGKLLEKQITFRYHHLKNGGHHPSRHLSCLLCFLFRFLSWFWFQLARGGGQKRNSAPTEENNSKPWVALVGLLKFEKSLKLEQRKGKGMDNK